MSNPDLNAIRAAAKSIYAIAQPTPLVPSPHLSRKTGVEVLLKLECMQPTGAFKLRGAVNAVLNLPTATRGVTCCSSGNHGRGIAFAAQKYGLRAVICMSELVPKIKVSAIRDLGAEVRIIGHSQDDAQAEVERLVATEGLTEVSPFDHADVIAGQGTIALELLTARPDLATLIVPLSGGGLAAGVAVGAKALKPDIRVIGVTMENGAAMHASIRAGHPVDVVEVDSLADSLGGGIMADNRLTLDLCSRLLDDTLLVSEAQIYAAMQRLYHEDRLIAEGAAAAGIAVLVNGQIRNIAGPVAVVISGRNVDMTRFTDIINGQDIQLGQTRLKGQPYTG
ncbi:MAG: hydroxyectoine utilization dehydratase EutB [Rhodobacteraceae bacterium]|nr:hydroxyectoine utilization dehydratase EutB [Paracoccaceae bacterium]